MTTPFRLTRRVLALGAVMLGMMATATVDALAQSANCSQLTATLSNLDRSADYRSLDANNRQLRSAQSKVQREESTYIRSGCNELARRGQPLPRQCQAQAQRVLSARASVAEYERLVSTGQAVAQQREAVLQESARFNCHAGSSGNVNRQGNRRGGFLDQLFGRMTEGWDGGGGYRFDDWGGAQGYHTVRTVCVRKSDGYFWPVSYSTTMEYAYNDAQACIDSCPGIDVELYLYDNPGQEPEQMRNINGQPYTSLPTAFKYREAFDTSQRCVQRAATGSISIMAMDGGGSRAIVQIAETSFALPLRDPRRPATVVMAAARPVDTATYVDVPLPRRRPAAPGETPPATPIQTTASADAAGDPMRLVQFGDRTVRIVGPDTPYALAAQSVH